MRSARGSAPHRVDDCVTVHSMGGLGNQLFIYAVGLAAAKGSGAQLRVDTGQHSERPDRPPILESLGFPALYVDTGPHRSPGLLKGRLARRWRQDTSGVPVSCTIREEGFGFDERALKASPGSCLFGYFQSWRYVEPVAAEIADRLCRLRKQRLAGLEPLVEKLRAPEAVTLHVRRGDYLAPGAHGYHGLASPGYYLEAVQVLRRMGHVGPVYVFSDDMDAARRELAHIADVQPVESPSRDPLDDLLLMSYASALVTANSSFSWWAAWIADRPGRTVISPRPWFDDPRIDDRDLLPPHWLTLDRREAPVRKRRGSSCE